MIVREWEIACERVWPSIHISYHGHARLHGPSETLRTGMDLYKSIGNPMAWLNLEETSHMNYFPGIRWPPFDSSYFSTSFSTWGVSRSPLSTPRQEYFSFDPYGPCFDHPIDPWGIRTGHKLLSLSLFLSPSPSLSLIIRTLRSLAVTSRFQTTVFWSPKLLKSNITCSQTLMSKHSLKHSKLFFVCLLPTLWRLCPLHLETPTYLDN